MLGFLVRRVLATIPVLAVVAVGLFMLIRLAPGDPAALIAGDNASPADIDAIRERLGLERPIHVQLGLWIASLLRGDFGQSIISGTPVLDLIASRLEPTVSLALTTIVVAVTAAVPLGVLAAVHRGAFIDRAVIGLCVIGFSVPVFVVGYVLILVFSVTLRWLPVQGFRGIAEGLAPFAGHIALPTAALSLLFIALIARITRTSVLDILNEDHVRTARAKGISEYAVLTRHVLRNAAVPIVTVVSISFASILTGVVVTESVFNISGVGRLTVDAVLARDYPVIQAVTLLASVVYVAVNLAADVLYALIDPRIRLSSE